MESIKTKTPREENKVEQNKIENSSGNSAAAAGENRSEEEAQFFKSNQNFFKQNDEEEDINKKRKTKENLVRPSLDDNTSQFAYKMPTMITTLSPKPFSNPILQERNKIYSEDSGNNQDSDRKLKQDAISENSAISVDEKKDYSNLNSERDYMYKVNNNNLNEYFLKNKSFGEDSNNNFNYMDEISVESLNSGDDKF